jgi:hypothetical protein
MVAFRAFSLIMEDGRCSINPHGNGLYSRGQVTGDRVESLYKFYQAITISTPYMEAGNRNA